MLEIAYFNNEMLLCKNKKKKPDCRLSQTVLYIQLFLLTS